MVYVDDDEYAGDAPPPPPPDAQIGVIAPGASPAAAATAGTAMTSGQGNKNKNGGAPDLGPQYNYPGLPGFVAPKFNAPTMADALNEPGYQFRLDAGRGALERSAAARGVLRSGGTLQNILEHGQQFGAQEYSNVFNRALQGFDRTYQGAKDAYAPQLAKWQTMAQGEIQRALALYNNQHRGGGGGGGQPQIPFDLLMGAPPVPPDYASIQGGAAVPAPMQGAAGGGGPYDMEDENPYAVQY